MDTAINRPVAPTRPEIRARLRQAGLRPTRQRMSLAELLFGRGNRHLNPDARHDQALVSGKANAKNEEGPV